MRMLEVYQNQQDVNKVYSALKNSGIDSHIREEGSQFSLWIEDEDFLPMAKKIHQAFLENPNATIFQKIIAPPPPSATDESKAFDVRTQVFFAKSPSESLPLLTYFVIAVCILTFMFEESKQFLMFSQYMSPPMPEIKKGEVWRLLTPVFLHGGLLHLIFNMMWMYQLGVQIEKISGFWALLAMIVIMGIICNLGQFVASGPNFVGLSGVVYGFLGYIWARQKWETNSYYFLPDNTMGFMMIWLVICVIGIIPNVANTQHVLGVIQGVVVGYLSSGHFKTYLRRRKYQSKF